MAIRYEVDAFVQNHIDEGSVTVSGVCSWRLPRRGRGQELAVDFHNGWIFESDSASVGPISDAKLNRAIARLKSIDRGTVSLDNVPGR